MAEHAVETIDYQEIYLPWANRLMKSDAVARLINCAQSDRAAILEHTVFFRLPLEHLKAELTLPEEQKLEEEEDRVELVADFEEAQLKTIALSSLRNYFVVLNPTSEEWPIKYGDIDSRRTDRIVKNELLRMRAERLIARTSTAMYKHIVHRVPIGNIPEYAHDWTFDEGELRPKTVNALHEAGIVTYGDLGILSVSQLQKINKLGKVGLADIKEELYRMRWSSLSLDQQETGF